MDIEGLNFVENFLTEEEEKNLLVEIDKSEWNNSLSRRTQHYGYVYNYTNKSANQKAAPIPEWSFVIIKRLLDSKIL